VMKICMVSPFPNTLGKTIGGVEAVTGALVPALASLPQVREINVLCFQQEAGFSRYQLSDKVAVWYFKGQKHLNLPTRGLLDLLQAWKFIRQYPHTVVHGQGISFMGDIATTISPFSVVSAHGIVHVEAQKALGRSIPDRIRINLTTKMVRRVLGTAKVVISTSDYDGRSLKEYINGKSISISNPVQPLFFTKTWEETREPYLLFAGVMHPRKNIEGIIRSFSKTLVKFPLSKLYIAGPQPDKEYAQKIINIISSMKIGHAVNLMGLIDNEVLAETLKKCAGVVMFSWEETSPTIIAQAMASSKPVIASNVGGISEMVQKGMNGYLVTAGAEDELASCMKELLDSRKLRRRMGDYAREIAWRHFDAKSVALKTFQAYQMVKKDKRI